MGLAFLIITSSSSKNFFTNFVSTNPNRSKKEKRILFFANFIRQARSYEESVRYAELRGGIFPFCEKVCPRQREFRAALAGIKAARHFPLSLFSP